ncbi:UNVERIFIED_ORG: hypothetical protein J2X79_001995 [Arthrobacter globiformis]|nr:hypothetical protein [Arthrobacter globiformis]
MFSALRSSMFADCCRSWERSESKRRLSLARTADGMTSLQAGRARGTFDAMKHSLFGSPVGAAGDSALRCRRRRSRCLLAQRVEQKRCVLRSASNGALHSAQTFRLTLVHRRGFTVRHDPAVRCAHGDGLGCQRCEPADLPANRAGLEAHAESDRIRVSGTAAETLASADRAVERRAVSVRLASGQRPHPTRQPPS